VHIRAAWSATSWIVEVTAAGRRNGKPFRVIRLFLTSLRTTPEALLQLVRDRWGIESWCLIRDTQLHEDWYRNRGDGASLVFARWRYGGWQLNRINTLINPGTYGKLWIASGCKRARSRTF
jgi:hypothetical protein